MSEGATSKKFKMPQPHRRTLPLLLLTLLLVGAFLLAGGIAGKGNERNLLDQGVRTTGTVLAIGADPGPGNGKALIDYLDDDGQLHQMVARTGSLEIVPDEAVVVYYDPEDPARALVDGFASVWTGVIIAGSLTAGIGAVLLGLLLYTRFRAARDRHTPH